MGKNYSRPLRNDVAVDDFLRNCVGLRGQIRLRSGATFDLSHVSQLVRDAENSIVGVVRETTLNSENCRVARYRDEATRQELRSNIVQELITLPRLDNDEEISLGHGGARPQASEPLAERNAYIVTGLPASGKSTLVNRIADQLGAMIVDSDYAKRKLPEFNNSAAGAQLVHDESALIVEGGDEAEPSLLGFCKLEGFNVVMPKIGHNPSSLATLRDALVDSGYNVHLTAVIVARSEATSRAVQRFLETRRYVPIAHIFDNYANDPALTYYKARVDHLNTRSNWHSFGVVSSSDGGYRVLDCSDEANPAALFKEHA